MLDQLKDKLIDTAMLISGKINQMPSDRRFGTFELEQFEIIETEISKIFDWCYSFSSRKAVPNIWNQTRLEDLFDEAQKCATEQTKKEAMNAIAEKKFVATYGNWVAVTGLAGMGKTTLTKKLLEKVLDKELLDIDFVFYVSLNKVNYDENMSVLQFLLTNLDSEWKHNYASDYEILKQLDKSEKVMIIFDGLDKATIELDKQCLNAELNDVAKPDILLKNFLNGNILPKAKKLITSRPCQMLELLKQYKSFLIVIVRGINHEAQYEICQDISGADSEKVHNELMNHPALLGPCYIPIICLCTMHFLHQKWLNPDQTVAFTSLTNIILNIVEAFARHEISKGEFELRKLSQLAWEGLRCKNYEFSEKEMKDLGLKRESLNTALPIGTKGNTSLCLLHAGKKTYFSNLMLQEFFSAVWLLVFLPLDDFKGTLLKEFCFDGVKHFIFGLCNMISHERLMKLQSCSFPDNSDFEQKRLFLEQLVCNDVEDLFTSMSLYYKDQSSEYFHKYLEICSLLYEMQDLSLTKKVVKRFPENLIIPYLYLDSSDVNNFCYVLKERQEPFKLLTCDEVIFVGDSCERLCGKILGMSECIKVSVEKFESKFMCYSIDQFIVYCTVLFLELLRFGETLMCQFPKL